MKSKRSLLILLVFSIFQISNGQATDSQLGNNKIVFNIRDFGATGDGKSLDSKAINKAIENANIAGGGTVFVPSGRYLTGSIHLKSHVCLYLDQGAIIIAAPVKAGNDYDEEEPSISVKFQDYGHSHWKNSLIWGYDIEDVSIMGPGMIDGKNLYRNVAGGSKMSANKAISLYRCRNVIMRDFSILHGGWFAILATGVDNLTIDNLKIDTNRDGMDIDCCKNVRVSNCFVNSPYDDGICLKSTYGLGYARATENVTITNCQVSGYDEGTLLDGTYKRTKDSVHLSHPTGRIKFGTESNGGFKNITVSNCVFDYCRGLALETVDGALLEDVTISNITMRDICNSPIFIRLGARMRGPENTPVGKLRRVSINNVIAYNVAPDQGILISGIPGNDVEDIELKNIKVYYKGGGTKEQASIMVPEKEKVYPEPSMFGTIPSYGIYIRHAKGINLENIDLRYDLSDKRPAIMLDDVDGASLRFVKAMKEANVNSLVLKQSLNIDIFESLNLKNQTIKEKSDSSLK
jgi:polygalacturonase